MKLMSNSLSMLASLYVSSCYSVFLSWHDTIIAAENAGNVWQFLSVISIPSLYLSVCSSVCDLSGTDYFIRDRQPTDRQTDRLTDRLKDWLKNWLQSAIHRRTESQTTYRLTQTDWHRQTDQQTDRETNKTTDWKRQKDVQAPRRFYLWYITYMYCTISDAGVFALDRLWTRGSPYLLFQQGFTRGVAEVYYKIIGISSEGVWSIQLVPHIM